MKTIQSLDDLQRFREEVLEDKRRKASLGNIQVIVSLGSCGIAAGALDTLNAIRQQIQTHHLADIAVSQTGCVGLCKYEPIVEIIAGDGSKMTYGRVTPEIVQRIFQEHVLGGRVVEEFAIDTTPFPTI